jgi:hypothetical protein
LKSFLLEVVYAEHYDEQNIEDDANNRTVEKWENLGKFFALQYDIHHCYICRHSESTVFTLH